ncbi:Putative glucanosyltransferase, glycoside hydrolase superfamily [Septoria linicola]|uniref:1,3-beta-glucanosyltransferase n=1 Tax=Septoria linicola TaxID=215465 RepID=A0A9Q9AXU0_9PEZI|nr:Putative glucanosyltransferase, glycoside hydrolase superfamily [Septoria linicola]
MLGLLLALVWASIATALQTIEAKGAKFFAGDDQWFIKGIAYQLTPDDPLAQTEQCQLDASLMKTLGANAIRVYHVHPDANHDGCMKAFEDAGIYIFLDLDTFETYVLPGVPTWNSTQYDAFAKVMDTFHNYDNLAGFFVGNELMTTGADSIAAPYVKAAARDMKAYRDSKGYRKIPIGYSAADITVLRPNLQNYMACGDPADALDFFSLNAYEWCGETTYEQSGYSALQKNASEYNIPIFFSETGCQTVRPRVFGDQAAIFGPEMSGTWSGAIIYEWIQEANDYGLISYGPAVAPTATGADIAGGYTVRGTPTPIQPDFQNLQSQWAAASPSGVQAAAYSPSLTAPPCPATTPEAWLATGPLPMLNQQVDNSSAGQGASGTNSVTRAANSETGTRTGTATSSAMATKLAIGGPALLALVGAGLL